MQVTGMAHGGLGYHYNGAFDALSSIIRTEGLKGLYRGLWPNLCECDLLSPVTCKLEKLCSESRAKYCHIILHV